MRQVHCALIKARKYYGSHATGWVALVDGQPHHVKSKAEAQEFIKYFQGISSEPEVVQMIEIRSMPEFAMLMKSFFGIKAANRFIDPTMTQLSGKIALDLFALDNYLHEKHGEYETEQGISMSELIAKEYGTSAHHFIAKMML